MWYSLCRADNGESDPGVARRALDNDAAGLQQSPPLGVDDDAERGAVLHGTAGVHELGLAEDPQPVIPERRRIRRSGVRPTWPGMPEWLGMSMVVGGIAASIGRNIRGVKPGSSLTQTSASRRAAKHRRPRGAPCFGKRSAPGRKGQRIAA